MTTCLELATALTKAGLKKFVLEFVAGNGFIPGVTRADQIADPANPCRGAVPRKHSHFFTKNRKFGSLDWRGQPVDDGTYRPVDNRTVVILKEFSEGDVPLQDPQQDDHVRSRDTQGLFHVPMCVGRLDGISREELAARALRLETAWWDVQGPDANLDSSRHEESLRFDSGAGAGGP